MYPILTMVRRIQGDPKYGRLPASALEVEYIVIGWETHDGKQWLRCIKPEAKAACDRGDLDPDWGRPMTYKSESTIFLPIEVTATGDVWQL